MRILLIYFLCCFQAICFSQQKTSETPPLFPFVISYDGPDNVTNMSHMLKAPAGKNGFIKVQDGHFFNDAGQIKFNATNLTGSANFPSHAQADLLTERLARFGFNCVRLHYMDAEYGNFRESLEPGIFIKGSQRTLDSIQLDRMDYMIAQFKKKGIYTNLNLHVARKFDEREGFTDIAKRPSLDKGVDNFEPRMVELQREFAKDLLTHVNPYTGLSYTNDPSIAMIEINNENALVQQYVIGTIDKLPNPYAEELLLQWNTWIHKKYLTINDLFTSWGTTNKDLVASFKKYQIPTVKRNQPHSTMVDDFYKFMLDTEKDYWIGMYDYLKNDLDVKPVISGTQLRYTSPFILAELDYVDIHAYWGHPKPVNPNWEILNSSMVNTLHNIHEMAVQRIKGKPFTISEYNHPFPNQYGAEAQPFLAAYGSLQNWDGIFQYTYNHRLDFEPQAMTYFFDMIARTDVLAHMPACAAIYLRGDVKEAQESIIAKLNHETYFDSLSISKKIRVGLDDVGFDSRLSLIKKTAIKLTNEIVNERVLDSNNIENAKIITSDTGELTWNREKEGAYYWTVNTSNTKLFTGFPEGRKIDLGDISIDIGKTQLGWATISLVSTNASGFGTKGKSANILLAATGLVENKGMVIENVSNSKIRLKDWGEGPIYAEGIPATIYLPSPPEKTKCFVLDSRGDRKKEIPVLKNNLDSKIVLKPEYETVWYEIEVR